ncbi:hypothetical protein EDC01DRAFT_788351 [Geopyxis carbonaria]|nr:hypothetical protein EDC01DRAFT_788351 [Geopyxis carbonaria]
MVPAPNTTTLALSYIFHVPPLLILGLSFILHRRPPTLTLALITLSLPLLLASCITSHIQHDITIAATIYLISLGLTKFSLLSRLPSAPRCIATLAALALILLTTIASVTLSFFPTHRVTAPAVYGLNIGTNALLLALAIYRHTNLFALVVAAAAIAASVGTWWCPLLATVQVALALCISAAPAGIPPAAARDAGVWDGSDATAPEWIRLNSGGKQGAAGSAGAGARGVVGVECLKRLQAAAGQGGKAQGGSGALADMEFKMRPWGTEDTIEQAPRQPWEDMEIKMAPWDDSAPAGKRADAAHWEVVELASEPVWDAATVRKESLGGSTCAETDGVPLRDAAAE